MTFLSWVQRSNLLSNAPATFYHHAKPALVLAMDLDEQTIPVNSFDRLGLLEVLMEILRLYWGFDPQGAEGA